MLNWINARVHLLLVLFCLFSFCAWQLYLSYIYYLNPIYEIDTVLHEQTIKNLAQGQLYNPIIGADFLAEHCTLISFLLAPIYKLFPDPLFLQNIKLLAFFIASYILFLILKQKINQWLSLLLVIAYTLIPSNIVMLQECFNYEPLAVPIIFVIYQAFINEKYRTFTLACFGLTLIKEQMPLVVMMFGVLALIKRKREWLRWGLTPILIGLFFFIIEVFVIIPYFRQDLPIKQSYYWQRYDAFGKTPFEILTFLLLHPTKVVHLFFTADNKRWIVELFNGWGWLSLLSPQILLLGLPLFVKNLVSNFPYEKLVFMNYYASMLIPFIFLASINTINYFKGKFKKLLILILLSVMFFQSFQHFKTHLLFPKTKNMKTIILSKFKEDIKPNSNILSDSLLIPYIDSYNKVYPLDFLFWGKYDISGLQFKFPEDIDYILIDNSHAWAIRRRFKQRVKDTKEIDKLFDINFNTNWRLKRSLDNLLLYERNTSAHLKGQLVDVQLSSFNYKDVIHYNYDGKFELQGVDSLDNLKPTQRIYPVDFYWMSLKKTDESYLMTFEIYQNNKIIYSGPRPIGSIYPTDYWKPGEYIKERYNFVIPKLSEGEYVFYFRVRTKRSSEIYEKKIFVK